MANVTPPELRLVAVNMSKWPQDLAAHKMYCCPCTDSGFTPSYRHYPAKYIANFVNKGAKYIGVVSACVRLRKVGPDEVLWRFGSISNKEAIAQAETVRAATQRNPRPCLVFLQEQLSATDFVYDAPGGLMNSCVYFDVSELGPVDVKDLAEKLRSWPWSELPKWKGR